MTPKEAVIGLHEWYELFSKRGFGDKKVIKEFLEIANLIETLEKQVPHWISVEERLPEEKELVLVHYTDGWMPIAFLLDGKWYNSGGERSWLSITHWMSLPKPPKEV